MLKENVYSKHLDEERSIRIYLPPKYNEALFYSIIYAQDGQDLFNYGRIATITNYLQLEEGIDAPIIVGIDVNKKNRTQEYSTVGRRNEQYKRFIAEELLPFVEARYKIRERGNFIRSENIPIHRQEHVSERLLLGDSLGATVSLDLALDYPQLFNKIISLSGAYFQASFLNLQSYVSLPWLEIWMVVGKEETSVDTHVGKLNFLEWNQTLRDMLADREAKVIYAEKEEGKHTWGFWQNELPGALRYFYANGN